jgi:phosphatidylglycerol:prolipoprotein diacylglycerol transferase
MFPFLQIGSLAIQVPGLVLLIGFWVGLTLSEKLVERNSGKVISAAQITNLAWMALVSGLIGARLGFVLRFPSAFGLNPLNLVSLNPGLLDPWFGFSAAVLAVVIIAQRKGFAGWLLLDAFTPLFASVSAAIALSNLASGARYGLPADLPWSIELFGSLRHPAQLYDFLAIAFIQAILWLGIKQYQLGDGRLFFTFGALSSGAILFLEAFHGTGPIWFGGLRAIQIAAWLALAVSLWFLRKQIDPGSSRFKPAAN